MVKTINVSFEDRDFERLNQVRAGKPWREFILSLVPKEVPGPGNPKPPGNHGDVSNGQLQKNLAT